MTRRPTRRSVSVKGLTYQRVKAWCDREERSVSGLLEEVIAERMDREGEPVHTELIPRKPIPMEARPGPTPVNYDFPTAEVSGGGLKTWQK